MYFTAPATLLKSKTKFEKHRIWVDVIASDESLDHEEDNMLAKSFTDDVRSFFLEKGIFDWDHSIIRGRDNLEKGRGLIGTPTEFFEEENDDGDPKQRIRGYLHRGNPFVDDIIAPLLKAGSDRLGVSIGGKTLGWQPNEHYKEHFGKNGKINKITGKSINKIWMNHLAFCPSYKAVNFNTSVVGLAKSTNEIEITHFKSTSDLLKSMEAGNNTDSATMTGAQAIQPQSLEGHLTQLEYGNKINRSRMKDELKATAINIMHDIVNGLIDFNRNSVRSQAINFGLTESEADMVSKLLLNNMSGKIKKLKNYK